MASQDELKKLELQKLRKQELSLMYEKAEEMLKFLKADENYTLWDLISLSCVILVNASASIPQIEPHVKQVLGILMDNNIQLRMTEKDDVLPIKS